ncbi:MAG: PAS domain S-box protein [Proteobacteria bacterium]|nr:PAS domain S-box protein [Pseudomonadota bacterium]MBU1388126.1 PAS domain S-box protein [Pseudomonadota bacterium]MBU1542190.1 PAS domain S-box protein [Pseudomonadota bacterium]MBU2481654.1 PAS domain S-box protein [Pseudomonadota bacterium]
MTDTNESADKLKKRIKELEEQNQRLNNIISKAPVPLFVLDKHHTITHFNQALENLSGLSANKMIGTQKQWKAFYSNIRPVMADLIVDQASDEQISNHYGLKYSGKNKDSFAATDFFPDLGEKGKWLFFSASPYTDSNGHIAGAVETLQDITEEKTAEKQTKELSRIYQNILEFIPYPVMVFNSKGLLSYINPAFTDIFKWTPEELIGRTVPFIPQGLESDTYQMLTQFQKNKSLARYETRRLTKQGKVIDVVIWASSQTRAESGETEHFVILRDITEEKRLEANNRTIMRISAVLPEYPELEDLMSYISKEIKTLLDTEGALILLYDEIKEELFFTGAAYDDSDTEKRARKFRFPMDSLLAGKIIKTGEYALVNDAQKLKADYPQRDSLLGYKTRNLLEVPIINEDRIIGVLCAINKKHNPFDYNDMELMSMIAGTCAISIENARFSEAVREAYRDVASMNRAKGKAINHLSHELKTPVAILTGSLSLLRKKLILATGENDDTTLERIERNLNRIVEIQGEVADIMEDKTYSAQKLLLKMFEACQDELETLIHQNVNNENFSENIKQLIDEKFGPRSMIYSTIEFCDYFRTLYTGLEPEFSQRFLNIQITMDKNLPKLSLPREILDKMITGLIKNAIENTPDNGRIDISILKEESGILFIVNDFGVGIEKDSQKRIFEGFFNTQDMLLYSTKKPFEFNAGGKGADLLRIKIFSDRLGLTLKMESKRCRFLKENKEADCPGNILKCTFCNSQQDCLNSGHSIFSLFFPAKK